ncbi:MAG: MATE family efflux transporter, partial [Eggerthellales bacterium]|nr:MATE family efflux transporter [Eggerthellales bacterium]
MATTDMNRHFGVADLLRLVAPAIVMMMFTSVYAIVDGLFISNFAGKTSFAAVNFVMPLLMILSSVGVMMGAGGSAQIALAMGSGDS